MTSSRMGYFMNSRDYESIGVVLDHEYPFKLDLRRFNTMITKVTKTPGTAADWELSSPPYGPPDLESTVYHALRRGYLTPRKRPTENLDIDVRNMPGDIVDMIWYLKESGKAGDTLSFAEGCLIKCGLKVIEQLFQEGTRSKEARKKAIEANNVDDRAKYLGQKRTPLHLGSIKVPKMRVFCLGEGEKVRLAELAHTYGLSMGVLTMYAMVAGVAQSTELLPKEFTGRAKEETEALEKWLKS